MPRALAILQSYDLSGYARPGEPGDGSRLWAFDGRAFACGGLAEWIRKISFYLETQGVVLGQVEHAAAADGCRIAINGRRYLICPNHDQDDGRIAAASAVQIVNELLESAGSHQRGYLLRNADNRGYVLFLSPPAYRRLGEETALRPDELPVDVGTYTRPAKASVRPMVAVAVRR
jgi:hypothetical protein